MAWFVNMAIECEEEAVAENIAAAYEGRTVVTSKHEIDPYKVETAFVNDLWYVYIEPRGLGWNEGPRNDELTTKDSKKEIREELYKTLKEFSGYRRAIFDEEAYDGLSCWSDPSDLYTYNWPDMIVADHLVKDPDLRKKMSVFTEGFLRYPPR
ncbi:hypothetical protein QEH56_24350 [Pelagicoccus enzymogenes]|uniref:hypothetical protein n=1 Tax=Pelagicoccus enzymogenes TaxID=2773457 RepID=UPI00280D0DB3|nr:hypothetical protein [Pelagicoccus enzymogenes]MDQ8201313.1 hypothetical protein [Pelagicoccus enzymogenes]